MSAAEQIAAAIRAEYPAEQLPDELAEQLAAAAGCAGIALPTLLLWIGDRPRHELSTAHLRRWSARYGLATADDQR